MVFAEIEFCQFVLDGHFRSVSGVETIGNSFIVDTKKDAEASFQL